MGKALRCEDRRHLPGPVVAVPALPLRTFLEMLRVAHALVGPRGEEAMSKAATCDALARAWISAYSRRPEVFIIQGVFKGPFDVKLLEPNCIEVDIAGRVCSMNFALSDAQDMWSTHDVELGIWACVGEPTGELRSTTLRGRYLQPADAIMDVPGGALVWVIRARQERALVIVWDDAENRRRTGWLRLVYALLSD